MPILRGSLTFNIYNVNIIFVFDEVKFMKLRPWVKMGLKIIRFFILLFIIFGGLKTSLSDNYIIKTEIIDINKTIGMSASSIKEWEDINKDAFATKAIYSGDLTGYSADCPMCNGTLSCKPSYNVYKNGVVTYEDSTYGNVRIVASSKRLSCGTVIRFNSNRISNEVTYAIVLDRGVLGYDIDLLVPSEQYASKYIGRSNISYEVVRFGW